MVYVAGAYHLRSNTLQAGKQGSQSDAGSSMWTVLVFGILTAIFTWVWFGGRGKRREPDAGVQQEGRAEDTAAAANASVTEPCTASASEKSGAGTVGNRHSRVTAHITSGESGLTAPAATTGHVQEVQYVQEIAEDEVPHASTGDYVHTHGKLGSPAHNGDAMQPKGGRYGENVPEQEQVLTYVEEGYHTDVPDRDGAQSNVEHMQSPEKYGVHNIVKDMQSPYVPDKDGVQSNLEPMYLPGVSEKDGVQTNVENTPTDVTDTDQIQSNVEYLPDVPGKEALQITEGEVHLAGILSDECVQSNEKLVHPLDLHEEDGMQPKGECYPENGQQKEGEQRNVENSPIDASERGWVQSNGEEPCHATRSVHEKVHPLNTQKVVHIDGEEEVQENNATGLLSEISVALTDQHTSVNILEATQESRLKEYDLFDNHDESLKDIMVSNYHLKYSSGQMDLVIVPKTLQTDIALDNHSSTNHSDTVELITGLQDNTDVAVNSISNETTYQTLTSSHILEEFTLQGSQSSPVLDKSALLIPVSHQDEESPGLKGSALDEKAMTVNDVDNPKAKRVAAIQPMPQNVNLHLKVHYITHSDTQIIAVTGDHKKLGEWEAFVPLTYVKDGIWSNLITLPADTSVEWKFVLVENGKINRWEECSNRCLTAAHEDSETQQWWGYP